VENVVSKEFTEILMCPQCKSDLEVSEKGNLLCKGCHEEYEIIKDIPVMLPASVRRTNEFIQFYNKLYRPNSSRDNVSRERKTTLSYLRKNLPSVSKVVLDMGGGEGVYARELAKQAEKVIVVDLSLPRLIRLSQAKGGNIVTICGDIQTLLLKIRVDVILGIAVLEHIPNPKQALINFKSLLKDEGKVCLYVPVLNLPFPKMTVFLYRRLRRFNVKQIEKQHLRIWSTKGLMADLDGAGFAVENKEFTSILTEFRRIPSSLVSFCQKFGFMDKLLAQGMHLICVHK